MHQLAQSQIIPASIIPASHYSWISCEQYKKKEKMSKSQFQDPILGMRQTKGASVHKGI